MATTGQNFVYTSGTGNVLVGTAVTALPALSNYGPKEANAVCQLDQVAGGSGAASASASSCMDRVVVDLSLASVPNAGGPFPVPEVYGTVLGGYAKNGSVLLELSGTTAQTISLINTATNTPAATAGDTVFANAGVIVVQNLGASAITISPGASNPARLPAFTGTTPTISVPAGLTAVFHAATQAVVDSTHTNLTFTPAVTGNVVVSIGGS